MKSNFSSTTKMTGLLEDLRNGWEVQALVLLSFTLQLFLLSFASIRRHNVSIVPRLLLWVAYQLADSTALFTLGHMAISSRSLEEQPLMAFWAPFLLVHLGGQDNITAYSFEDNRLWLRHLQTLVVQVVAASYVLYKYIFGEETLVMIAAVLIFVVGILKYGERIWALRSAGSDNLWRRMDQQDASKRETERNTFLLELLEQRWSMDAESVLMGAHGLLDVCVGLFIGSRGGHRDLVGQVLLSCKIYGHLDKLMELELSLMYDILYTKATVIHTWYGCCIRVIALAATAAACLLFERGSKDVHSSKDIAITYALLIGALLLEIASAARAIESTWTCASFYSNKWRWIHGELLSLSRLFKSAKRRCWSGSVGQYNLLQACERDAARPSWEPRGMATAKWLGLRQTAEQCWDNLVHSWTTELSGSTKELVLREILGMAREEGEQVGSLRGLRTLKNLGLDRRVGWTIQDIGFEDSIMAWHLASDICLFEDRSNKADLVAAIRVLSNYMMFLLVLRRHMLPGPVRRSRYDLVREDLHKFMRGDKENSTRQPHRLQWALRKGFHAHINSHDPPNKHYDTGIRLAAVLYNRHDKLDVIFGVWVEMLCYVASHCSRESHARELSCGGELVTIVWLMARHVDLS